MNFLKYSLVRIGLMVLVFAICWYLNIGILLAGVFAILIAFAVSYLAFPRLHAAAGADLQGWLGKLKPRKNKVEQENQELEDNYVELTKKQQGEDF